MMNRFKAVHCACAVAILFLAGTSSAEAQIVRVDDGQQSIGFNLGYFALRGADSRVGGDVLIEDLFDVEPLAFDIKDFNGATVGAEWLFPLGDYLEGGIGAGFYQKTVPSVYANVVNDNGSEIEQDLKLRVVPLTATVRFLPIGRGGVEPYVGAGVGLFNWKYSEVGDFVDTSDYAVFSQRYVATGNAFGPLVLGGIRFPVADAFLIGAEIRYQKAEGTDLLEQDFVGDKIDLGGWSTSATFHIRF
jgi:opacity protein-like surface antigen